MATLKSASSILLEDAKSYDERALPQEMVFSASYLTAFGYLAKAAWDNRDEIVKAVKTFQSWYNLKKDGVIGPKTMSAMQAPRCGFPDILQPEYGEHSEAMALMEHATANLDKWQKKGLTYYIKSYVGGSLSRSEQEGIIQGAWNAWNKVCGINVTRSKSENSADLIIDTGAGKRSNFDGAGGTLAWAYLPQGANFNDKLLMRFDLGETWISNPSARGILMFNVACHEFGHMLGLGHSKKQGALMAPYYNPQIAVPQWDDDIPRVESRYGKLISSPTPAPAPTPPSGGGGGEEYFNVRCTKLEVAGYTLFKNG
jgi:hypothetical protein